MGRALDHPEVLDLLGAYALHAVDDDEKAAVEAHLESCTPCRREVAEHQEVAAFLASGWLPAPEGLWDRIASSLEESPPPMRMPPVVSLDDERRRRRPWATATRAAAAAGVAASVVLIGLVGVKVVSTSDQVDRVATALHGEELAQAATAAAARPDARTVAMRSPDGIHSAEAVILSDGTGYLMKTNLPTLPPERTYQLWAVVGANKISVGVLGRTPGPAAFRAAADVSAFAITEEVAGGVVVSQKQPSVVGTLA